MHREVFNQLLLTKLLSDISSYFRVYDFLKVRAKSLQSGSTKIIDEADFWSKVLGSTFREEHDNLSLANGSIVKFENFFLTDWSPKLPGGLWTKKGYEEAFGFREQQEFLEIGDRLHEIIAPNLKTRRINAGFGSLRVNPIGNNLDYFNYMNLVSPKYWNVDKGIPVIVPKSVYSEYINKSRNGASWVESLEGILILNESLPLQNFISNSIGHKLSDEIISVLSNMPHLPRCYVYVPSRLSIKIRTNDTHPVTTAWTMFETERNKYGLTYCLFNPFEKDAFEKVAEFLEKYAQNYGGKRLITDFDGITPRLKAKITLTEDPMEKNISDYKEFVEKVDSNI